MQRDIRVKMELVITLNDDGFDVPQIGPTLTELDLIGKRVTEILVPTGTVKETKVDVSLTRTSMFAVNKEKRQQAKPQEQAPETTGTSA